SFVWRPVVGASTYELYTGTASEVFTRRGTSTTPRFNNVQLPPGVTTWFVRALRPGCDPLQSAISRFTVAPPPTVCAQPAPPTLTAPASVTSGVPYVIRAQRTQGAGNLLIQEATTPEFSDGDNFVTPEEERRVSHINTGSQPRLYYYRARFFSNCGGPSSDFSQTIAVYVLPSVAAGAEIQGSAPADQAQTITYTIPIETSLAGSSFAATPTEPWITVTPSSGIVPVGGLSLTATVRTAGLPVGTSIGGVTVTTTPPSLRGSTRPDATTPTSKTTTVSISLVQPVVPNPKSAPPPDALIIPAVAHATGMNSRFESDVRVTNTSAQVMKYQITFTPTGEAGMQNGKQTTLDIEPGRTIALDDILETWFNSATTAATGTLEIRPLTQVSTATTSAQTTGLPNFVTFASSRTFSISANGTFGQFVPAIPFANFIGPSSAGSTNTILSLQQIAQSAAYRTNLGLVEGSGQAATALVSVFSSAGQKLTEFPVQLTGGQHVQLNSFLAARNLEMTDGRVEVRLASPTGRVTAYASVIDQTTDDPVLVEPVNIAQTGSTRFVLGGVADIVSGLANWRSDVRIFNPSTRSVDATLLFHALSGGAPRTAQITIAPNEVRRIDNTLASLFGVTNDGGALHINTVEPANLIATARTYNQTATGTFGQSISAVTPNEAAALGTRPLQLLQIEESTRYRTNVAIAEVSGNAAKVELTIIPQDSKTSANIVLDLAPNQYRQINSILRSAGFENSYNARVTVRVIEGTGRVTAFASVIDAVTQDPTLIPAQ
ncbi:MAG TPA: hypothetical protein VFL80_02580, partial [Thermoanaerobaculia bacterium]|nr:hypothetical protein [Thermoanaerobaculia bacterium]